MRSGPKRQVGILNSWTTWRGEAVIILREGKSRARMCSLNHPVRMKPSQRIRIALARYRIKAAVLEEAPPSAKDAQA